MDEFTRIPCVIMRGGTSKGIFIKENHLPKQKAARDEMILAIFGSPDIRQIDGLGGADPLTSKLAIIAPPSCPGADIDYTFGQVSIQNPVVDYSGNCGNISAAVGPFAIDEGMVKPVEPITTVRIHNVNTGKILIAEVPVTNGRARISGDCVVDGVSGSGAKIMMDFSDTAGATTGRILPTGNPVDRIKTSKGELDISVVDVSNTVIFVRAKDLELDGGETPQQVNSNPEMLGYLEEIRAKGAVLAKMAPDEKTATEKTPAFPMIAFVSPAHDYVDFITGNTIQKENVDFVSRIMFMQVMHKTYAGTGTACTGAAAKIKGTIVSEMTDSTDTNIRIGHPAGVIEVEADVTDGKLIRASLSRTARRIMEGYVYVENKKLTEQT